MFGSPQQYFGWRRALALLIFLCALAGLMSGVSLTERPDVVSSSLVTKAYYALGLFVVGGLDIGTPVGGPIYGRVLLWFAYFAAPLLAASAVIDAMIRVISPERWELSRLRNHIIIVGADELTTSFLRVLRNKHPNQAIVVVDSSIDIIRQDELRQTFRAKVLVSDVTHDFVLSRLRLHRARRVLLLGNDNFQAYEAATKILTRRPQLAGRVIVHVPSLRFLRAMSDTRVAQQCIVFNSYHLAAKGLVQGHLVSHFEATAEQDNVVIAGFGLFGQTILEELQRLAPGDIERVALIDLDAHRRVQVVEEQNSLGNDYELAVFEGDVSHPEVWRQLRETIDLNEFTPTVLMSTGATEHNLRTALWIKQRHPNALVFARSADESQFAHEVAEQNGISSFGITQLVESNIPDEWL